MFGVRYAYLLALGTWLGAMLALGGFVAPAIFRVLQAHDPVQGRSLAAAVFASILHSYHYLAYGAAITLMVCLAAMALITRPRGVGIRFGLVTAMLAMTLYSGRVVSPRAERLLQDMGAPIQSLSASDPRRIEFGRLHRLSTTLMGMTVAGCLLLLAWGAREGR